MKNLRDIYVCMHLKNLKYISVIILFHFYFISIKGSFIFQNN